MKVNSPSVSVNGKLHSFVQSVPTKVRKGVRYTNPGVLDGAVSRYTLEMGLTLHYQGQLRSESAYETFVRAVPEFAAKYGWPVHLIPETRRERVRMLQPEDPDAPEAEEIYDGPIRGLYALPHAQCEPLTFEFDRDLFMQHWCKTQFAGAPVHAAIVQLFREMEPLFEMLDIQDEAEFWDDPDTAESRKRLEATFDSTRAEIDLAAAESPGSSVGVMTPSGRILDVLAA